MGSYYETHERRFFTVSAKRQYLANAKGYKRLYADIVADLEDRFSPCTASIPRKSKFNRMK